MKKTSLLFLVTALLSTLSWGQEVQLPRIFSDNMVLQRNADLAIWGWATPGAQIKVQAEWDKKVYYALTDIEGDWDLKIKTPEAGGPYTLSINQTTLSNVLIGEVWLASGQSNMQWALTQSENFEAELPNTDDSDLRLFYVARQNSDIPLDDVYGYWGASDSTLAKTFSAVAYYYGKKLRKELNIPIGIIHVSWGGSSAQAWMNPDILASSHSGKHYLERYANKIANAKHNVLPRNHQSPSSLYNGMLKPLIPFGIRGVIWYQGESNRDRPDLYQELFGNLIKSWRQEWNIGDFPFYFVQLAPFKYNEIDMGAFIRDAQRRTLDLPNTGMAVTMDIGNVTNIHPTNKLDVGNRLALWALAKDYGYQDLIYSGPILEKVSFEDQLAILSFSSVGSGLTTKGQKLSLFEIAGTDQVFYPAKGKIDGNRIILKSSKVKKPVSARYASRNTDEAILFNSEGLPAGSFRTDQWLK